MGKQEAGDKERYQGGKLRLRGFSTRLDHTLSQWCADDTRFEKPLRTVFLTILGLAVAVLTVQNIVSEFRSLREPQDVIVQTAERLLMQQRAFGAKTLDQVTRAISADEALQNAIRNKDRRKIRQIADKVFAEDRHGLEIAEFTIYGADQSIVYRGQRSGVSGAPDSSFQNDLYASLFRKSNGIEFGPDNQVVVSVFRSWLSDGQMLGYLKLSIDIEHTLALAGSAVHAQIVKVHEIGGSDGTASGAVEHKVLGDPGPAALKMEASTVAGGLDGLNGFHLQAGKVFVVRDLPIPIAGANRDIKLVLVKDATSNAWAFLERTVFAILAAVGLALLSWFVIHRLLSRLQASVRMTRARLESEVLKNTRKLERSALQLMEAQRIASVGSWERDIATNEIQGSEEFYRVMDVPPGLSANEIQERIFSRIPKQELKATRVIVEKAIAECGEFDFEHSLMLEDGSVRYLHVLGYVLAGPAGKAATIIGTVHDITDRCQAERQNNLLANILESSLNEIYILNTDTFRIEYANKCALTNLGYSLEELKARRIWDINPVYDLETVRRHVAPLLRGARDNLSVESLHKRKDGSEYPVDLRVQCLKDHDRDLFVAIANDVSERVQRENETREAKVRAERLAYFDPLTKLSNRAGCQRDAKARFSSADKPAFLIHVDMDSFKRVNDTLGHLAGDECLEETGRRLREVCRGLGTAYRWGGDEFVIIANSSGSDANELCERARRLMRAPMEFNGNKYWPTVSMGIALCPDAGSDFDTLLVNSDLALYQSKENGKDRYTFFQADMKANSETEAKIELELHDAVDNGRFVLAFQPQVNLRTQKISGVEALVRWNHPERGLLSPAEFLPVVEKTSLAPILGEIVIDTALAAAKDWLESGFDFGRISVNISPSHLASGLIVDHFRSAMAKHDVGPERITAEVLESVFLNDNGSGHLAALKELYELGIHIELDDFGTGYASLSHLVDLPIHGLKIDRSFTKQMLEDPKKEAVVNQLIHLARSLNIGIVCEGVENEAQYDRLRMMGDFSIQGYLIAKPMFFGDMTRWMGETADDLYFVV